jgi:hypothetical protein
MGFKLVGRVEGEGVKMRGRLWGPVVHVPLGCSTAGALPSRRPARHRVGPSSVALLQVAERVLSSVHRDGSDGVSCARGGGLQASSSAGGLSDRSVGDMTHGLELQTLS